MELALELLDDTEQLEVNLQIDERRLCSPPSAAPDVLTWLHNEKRLHAIQDTEDLDLKLNALSSQKQGNSLYIIKSENTLGRLLISLQHLQRLLEQLQAFAPFSATLRAFGRNGSDESYSGCHRRSSGTVSEICYNIRYPALHGRTSRMESPWSMRHMAAYQQYDQLTRRSRLVLVQPTAGAIDRSERVLQAEGALEASPALPHIAMLEAAETGWEPYIQHLKQQGEDIASKVLYAKVGARQGQSKAVRYTIDKEGNLEWSEVDTPESTLSMCFKDMQKLEAIHEKLLTCSAVCDSSLQIAAGCLEFCGTLGGEEKVREASCNKIRLCIARFSMHSRATELARQKCDRASKLLSQILDFRNEEETINSSHTMRDMLKIMTDLGASAQEESESLRILSEHAQSDARFTKILTFVAMLYLPASLVATIFSSNLIESVAVDQSQEPQKFAPAAQFWLFPVLALALTIVTLIPAVLFQRLQKTGTNPGRRRP